MIYGRPTCYVREASVCDADEAPFDQRYELGIAMTSGPKVMSSKKARELAAELIEKAKICEKGNA